MTLKYIMSENIELLFNIKEIQICWREECTTDARITTPPSQTSTRSSRPPVSDVSFLLQDVGDLLPSFLLRALSISQLQCLIARCIGGRLTIQYLKRSAGASLAGIPRLRSPALSRLTRTQRTVARPYGGKLTHSEVRDKYASTLSLLISQDRACLPDRGGEADEETHAAEGEILQEEQEEQVKGQEEVVSSMPSSSSSVYVCLCVCQLCHQRRGLFWQDRAPSAPSPRGTNCNSQFLKKKLPKIHTLIYILRLLFLFIYY